MAAADDVERIKHAYAEWNRADLDATLAFVSENVVVRPLLGDVVSVDTFHGHVGMRRWFEAVHSAFDDFHAGITDVIDAGARRYVVLVRLSGRGSASGAEVARDGVQLITVGDDALITDIESFESADDARRAAGIESGA
jgi:ketosteroid isomerase-like protein